MTRKAAEFLRKISVISFNYILDVSTVNVHDLFMLTSFKTNSDIWSSILDQRYLN